MFNQIHAKNILVLLSMIFALAFSSHGLAEKEGDADGKGAKNEQLPQNINARYMNILKRELLLSEEQAEKIQALQKDAREERREQLEEQRAENEELKAFLTMPPEGKEYDKLVEKTAAAAAERAAARIKQRGELRKDVYALLNEQQQQRFLELSVPRRAMRAPQQGSKPEKAPVE